MEEKQKPKTHPLIQQFLEYLEIERNASKLTIRNYKFHLGRFYEWFSKNYPDKDIKDLNLDITRKYRLYLSNYEYGNGMTLTRITQSYYIIALRSFLKYLIRHDYEVLAPDKIDLPKAESKSLKFLEKNHLEELFNAVDVSNNNEKGLRDRAIIEMLFYCCV